MLHISNAIFHSITITVSWQFLDAMMGICVELLIESAFDISSVPHPAFTMSCSDTDPYCVSYPAIVLPTEQILVQTAAESIAYGMLIPQCTYTILKQCTGCFIIVAIQAIYQLMWVIQTQKSTGSQQN